MKTFQSTPITFIDQTDSRKLEVYIKNNMPTVQIRNSNSGAFTPNWIEEGGLKIEASVFLDSRIMETEYSTTDIKWYKNDVLITNGINVPEVISGDDDYHRTLTITDKNVLDDNPIITYTCEATYQGIVASTRITFTRIDTGRDGQKGADGTSVRILGTAKSAELVDNPNYYTIVYDTGAIVAAELGDAYVLKSVGHDLDGHLFVCALLNGGQDGATDYFIDAGQIQGPAGDPAKNITLIGSAQVFKVGKDGKTITPKAITITAHTVNIDDNSGIKWWYKYDTDVTWTEMTNKIIQDTNNKTIISINNSNDVATVNVEHLSSLTSIALRATYESAEDALTLYKVFDGIDGEKGNPGDDAPIVLLSNEHISFVADANGETYGVQQNIPTNVVAYRGTTKVEPQINLTLANASLPEGMSISIDEDTMASIKNINPDFSEIILKVSVDSGVNLGSTLSNNGMIPIQVTSPADVVLQLNWTKVNAGTNGVDGKTSYLHIAYATSSDGKSGFSVSDSVSKTYIGQYTDYTEDDSTDPTKYKWTLIKGDKGDQGVQGPKGNDGQQFYTWIKYADTPTSGMSNDPTGKTYIGLAYNKTTATESSTYSDYMWSLIKGETGPTGPKGDNGQQYYTWIKYADNASGANMSDSPTGKLYIGLAYNKTTSTESNVATDYTWALFKGDKGDPGTSASIVDVTPSALYFKSSTGSAGPFEPQYIYLYPRFQNATYSNWQYSRDGGTTWASVSGANGLTVATYNSAANSLRIDRASTLYTDTITSISFKCNSTTIGVYDTVSIAKIYDVADLQIGGRNLLKNNNLKGHGCKFENLESVYNGIPTFQITAHTNDVGNNFGFTLINPIEIAGGTYTMSYWYKFTKFQATTGVLGYLRVQYSDGTGEQFNASIPSQPTYADNLNKWFKVEHTFTTNPAKTATSITHFYFYKDNALLDDSAIISYPKLEVGNTSSDWSPAPEDLIEEAANVNVMLSNEAHFFEATAGGVPIDTSVTLDVVGYKGSVKSATTVGTIVGIPSAGMTATITNNNTTNTKLTIAVTSALTSDIADYGILTIPITVNGHTINKIFNWTKAKAGDVGASGSDAVTFQVYSNNGYALSTSVPTITLQTFAYVGDVEIKAGATYQWYRHNNTDWVAISGATNDYFNVSRDDVTFSNNYQCKMQFGGAEYVGVVTIEDKNDENKVFASKPYNYFAGDLWIVGTDYTPPSYTVGTMLRAEHTNTGYIDSDWVPATKYDDEIKDLRNTVDSYKQYFSVNSTNGLQIGNSSINNDILTTDTVDAANINADSASLESLDIIGKYSGSTMLQAPVINLGKFSIVIESNGSLSIVANT